MLKNLFTRFIKSKIDTCSEEYFYILRIIYMNLNTQERYLSNFIKSSLDTYNVSDKNKLSKKIEKTKKILSKIEIKKNINNKTSNIPSLKSVQIKDFRSFGHFDDGDKGVRFELDKNKNILFAPNGGGKSSFCEALEYKLTGEIKEAKRRNINISSYIKYKGNFSPKINIEFLKEDYTLSIKDKSLLKYSFIEKNRLNEFALLGSKDTGTNEKDILAILLDLEELDNFISKLVQGKSLSLESLKSNSIETKNKVLLENKQEIEQDLKEYLLEIKELNKKEKLIQIRRDLKKIKRERSDYNNKILQLKSKKINFHTNEKLEGIFDNCSEIIKKYDSINASLFEKKDKQNYKKLYESIIELKKEIEESNSCPVCDTSFDVVKNSPIEKANIEIKKLSDILKLEEEKLNCEQELQEVLTELKEFELEIKNNLNDHTDLENEVINFILDVKETDSLKFLKHKLKVYKEDNLKNYFKIINDINDEVSNSTTMLENFNSCIKKLEKKEDELKGKIQNYKSIPSLINKKNIEYQKIKNDIKNIKKDLDEEKEKNTFIDNVSKEYIKFKEDLEKFKLEVEQERLSNIENDTLSFYNQINKHDDESEYLNNISFEKNSNKYNINIEIGSEKKDAFSYLSEGHLRTLGLSIMLSLIKKSKLPFIIFDDVVNAIDSEHRANIIEMFYCDSFLQNKQLIITTHDRLFWEKFSQLHHDKNQLKSFILRYTNFGTIYEEYDIDFRSKIIQSLESYDVRQALLYCRIWFETEIINYCIVHKKELRGNFSVELKGNLLKPSLEKIYNDIIHKEFAGNSNLEIIRNGLNWSIQNQEHHTFDENTYNVVHSKTSNEIKDIFEAINSFVFILFEEREKKRIKDLIIKLFEQYESLRKKQKNIKLPYEIFLKFEKDKNLVSSKIMKEIENLRKYEDQKCQ